MFIDTIEEESSLYASSFGNNTNTIEANRNFALEDKSDNYDSPATVSIN